jgi:hypothetical protein
MKLALDIPNLIYCLHARFCCMATRQVLKSEAFGLHEFFSLLLLSHSYPSFLLVLIYGRFWYNSFLPDSTLRINQCKCSSATTYPFLLASQGERKQTTNQTKPTLTCVYVCVCVWYMVVEA